MAGAQAESVAFQIKEQYYTTTRHHLEQAELGSGASSFWTIEAAQALVLVTRFEFENFAFPRAKISMSRLFALMSILGYHEISGSEKGQGLDEEELNQQRIVSLINISIKFQEQCVARNTAVVKVSRFDAAQVLSTCLSHALTKVYSAASRVECPW